MILSAALVTALPCVAVVCYLAALAPAQANPPWPTRAWQLGWGVHGLALLASAFVHDGVGLRIGFAPVLSFTLWLVALVHGIESRFVQVGGVRRALALAGVLALPLAWAFPGELRPMSHSPWAPWHWLLGLTSYGLFGAAVLHAILLDTAERKLRQRQPGVALGLPLLKLERLTFRFVEAGFVVLSLALLLGVVSGQWRWDHKTVLSLLGWATLAALIAGRLWRGWRGLQATRWLYAGTLLLLLAYVGSRFVMEVLLHRAAAAAG